MKPICLDKTIDIVYVYCRGDSFIGTSLAIALASLASTSSLLLLLQSNRNHIDCNGAGRCSKHVATLRFEPREAEIAY